MYGHLCIRRLQSGLDSQRRPPGDLGGLPGHRPCVENIPIMFVESERGDEGLTGVFVMRRSEYSSAFESENVGDAGSLMLLSHDTPLLELLNELKLRTLILSKDFSPIESLSLILSRARRSMAFSSSRRRSVITGDESGESDSGESDKSLQLSSSPDIRNLHQGSSKSQSSLRYDVNLGSFFRYRSISRQF